MQRARAAGGGGERGEALRRGEASCKGGRDRESFFSLFFPLFLIFLLPLFFSWQLEPLFSSLSSSFLNKRISKKNHEGPPSALSCSHFFFPFFYLCSRFPGSLFIPPPSSAVMPRGTDILMAAMEPSVSAEFGNEAAKLGGGSEVRWGIEFFSLGGGDHRAKPNRGDSSIFSGLSARSTHGFALGASRRLIRLEKKEQFDSIHSSPRDLLRMFKSSSSSSSTLRSHSLPTLARSLARSLSLTPLSLPPAPLASTPCSVHAFSNKKNRSLPPSARLYGLGESTSTTGMLLPRDG